MKYFNEFVNEEMSADEIKKEAPKQAKRLDDELKKMFPKFNVDSTLERTLVSSIDLEFYGQNPKNNIARNSPTYLRFQMILSDKSGDNYTDKKKFEWDRIIGKKNLNIEKYLEKQLKKQLIN